MNLNFNEKKLNTQDICILFRSVIQMIEVLSKGTKEDEDLIRILKQYYANAFSKFEAEIKTVGINEFPINPIDLSEYCGVWNCTDSTLQNGNESFFRIVKAGDNYYITFDEKQETLYLLEVEEDDVYIFFIGDQWHKLCVNTSCKTLSLICFTEFLKTKRS